MVLRPSVVLGLAREALLWLRRGLPRRHEGAQRGPLPGRGQGQANNFCCSCCCCLLPIVVVFAADVVAVPAIVAVVAVVDNVTAAVVVCGLWGI